MTNADLKAEVLRLRAVLENVGAYIFTKDLQGRYTYVNSLVLQLFNVTEEQVLGHTDDEFFDLTLSNELRLNDKQVMEHGQTLCSEERNIVKETGEERIYWTVKAPVRDDQGNIVGMCGISTDITERKKLERELEEQRELLDTVVNNIDASIYMKTRDRRFDFVNQQCANLFNLPPSEIVGHKDVDVLPPEIAEHFWELDKQTFESGVKQVGPESYTHEDGSQSHYWSIKVPLNHLGKPDTLIGFSTDITEFYRLKEEFKEMAYTDGLTGLSNLRHFKQESLQQLQLAKRYKHPLSVLTFDLDHFKKVNDTYGHPAGDKVLKQIASITRECTREVDIVGRLGGEEFSVLLPSTDIEAAYNLARRLCEKVASTAMQISGQQTITQTISIGVAELLPEDEDINMLMSRADLALYQAKSEGRNRVCINEHHLRLNSL